MAPTDPEHLPNNTDSADSDATPLSREGEAAAGDNPAVIAPSPVAGVRKQPTGILKIFLGPHGLRSGWRVALFFVLAVTLIFIAGLAVTAISVVIHARPDNVRLWGNVAAVVGVVGATFLMVRVDRGDDPTATIARAGLGSAGAIRNALTGAVCGFVALSLLMGALRAAGLYVISPPSGDPAVWFWAIYWVVQFVCTGCLEEISMRGYPLATLTRGMGFWPAAILLAVLFGAGHLGNTGEAWVGIANAVIVGVVFALSVRFTGSLWWAIGAHAAWDWAETYFWGVSDSGFVSQHHLFAGRPMGAELLSGGSVGPEGSLLCLGAIALLLLMARFTGYRAPGELETLPTLTEPPAGPPAASTLG